MVVLALTVLLGVLALVWLPAGAGDTPQPRSPIRGWSPGTPAAGTASVLQAVDPLPLAVPNAIAELVEGETAIFYFSPSCGHCRAAMADVRALQGKGGMKWVGVATANASPAELIEFKNTFAVDFPIVSDMDRHFARAVGARSTPSVYVLRPAAPAEDAEGAAESAEAHAPGDGHDHAHGHDHGPADPSDPTARTVPAGHTTVLLAQAYPPFPRGAGPVLLLRSHLSDPFADFDGYQGDVVCRGCHEQEALSMAISHHSVALYTLYERGDHEDPACVSCHVTGMGEPGGFEMGDLSHPLGGVQCEACHGPAGPHDGTRTDARSQCVSCHDADHSVAFTVEKGLPHIDHYAANGLSDLQLRARLEAVAKGTADKPLLAFPEGPTAGSASCRSCHSSTHKSWRKSPHGKAMKSLQQDNKADDPACVSCHATQRSYGLGAPDDAVAHFRTDESVGCESCHGPGVAHVGEPRKDNIVGLTGSCPECVIEAICTGCHDPEWDPEWNLDVRMKGLDHHAAED